MPNRIVLIYDFSWSMKPEHSFCGKKVGQNDSLRKTARENLGHS